VACALRPSSLRRLDDGHRQLAYRQNLLLQMHSLRAIPRFGVGQVHVNLPNPLYVGDWRFNRRHAKPEEKSRSPKSSRWRFRRSSSARLSTRFDARSRHVIPGQCRQGLRRDRSADWACPLRQSQRRHDIAHGNVENRTSLPLLLVLRRRAHGQDRLQGPVDPDGRDGLIGDQRISSAENQSLLRHTFTANDAVLPFPLLQSLDRVDSQLDLLIYEAFPLPKDG
jgi:hypothetical protein